MSAENKKGNVSLDMMAWAVDVVVQVRIDNDPNHGARQCRVNKVISKDV